MSEKKNRVLAMFSGGLDSIIVVKYMEKLGYEVIPVFFSTPFFMPAKAQKTAEINKIALEVIDISDKHLEMLKAPVYGFGKHLNPCIDCHGLMFSILQTYLEQYDADFMVSGEVLNQRPMSQRRDALNAVRKLSGAGDLIIRPLCQKLLPDTLPIREGWVKKEDMLDINGRSRARQMALAEELGVVEYPNSGGGCLLTDKGYTKRLQDLVTYENLEHQYIQFLEFGRHFRLNSETKVIITRTKGESDTITPMLTEELVIKCKNIPGPLGVIQSNHVISLDELKLAGSILLRYNGKSADNEEIEYGKVFQLNDTIQVSRITDLEMEQFRIN